jgi:hypothetical protein
MRHATLLIFSIIALAGCVSEQVTYERNLQPNHISRHARLLSQADREQIARLMAHRTNQPIICLCASSGGSQSRLVVYTAYIGAHDRGDYGAFTLKKFDGQWKILEGGTDLDPIFACMLCSEDR